MSYPRPLKYWCQMVLPLVYDDSLSYYELLCKVKDYINKLIKSDKDIMEAVNANSNDIKQLQDDVELLEKEFAKIKNGEYINLYITALQYWIDNNLQELVGSIVKYVFFTIDDNGYFNANIPPSWQFIKFSTDYDPTSENYLHLILEY